MDKARIRDLEGLYSAALHKIDELEAQCATAEDEIYELIQDRMKIHAQAAAMREALESVRGIIECNVWDMTTPEEMLKWCVDALAPDAGRDLWKRLRKAEAERVEAVSTNDAIADIAMIHDRKDKIVDAWTYRRVMQYLRANHMIREAE